MKIQERIKYIQSKNKKNYRTIFSGNELLLSLSFDLDLKMCKDSKILKLTRSLYKRKLNDSNSSFPLKMALYFFFMEKYY